MRERSEIEYGVASSKLLAIALMTGMGLGACEGTPKPSAKQPVERPALEASKPATRAQPPAPAPEPKSEAVRVTNEAGLDATSSNEIPADFPLKMPPVAEIKSAQRVEQPDGSKVFNVTYEAVSDELAAEATRWEAEFESMGLRVERTEMSGGGSHMITLKGQDEAGEMRGSCILSVSPNPSNPGIMAVVTWSEASS